MKKSIISAAIALGLAASASASTVLSETNPTSSTYTLSSSISAFTMTVVLDPTTIESVLTSGDTTYTSSKTLIAGIGPSGKTFSLVGGIDTNNSSLAGVYAGPYTVDPSTATVYSSDNQYSFSATGDYTNVSNSTLGSDAYDWSNVTGAAITMTSYGSSGASGAYGTLCVLTLTFSDGISTSYAGVKSNLHWSGWSSDTVYVNTSVVSSITISDTAYTTSTSDIATIATVNTAAIAAAAAAVPEPATATLSLLALAGLAARRRRK